MLPTTAMDAPLELFTLDNVGLQAGGIVIETTANTQRLLAHGASRISVDKN